jgi:hypothetical protein
MHRGMFSTVHFASAACALSWFGGFEHAAAQMAGSSPPTHRLYCPPYHEPTMNKSSERLVVFVTPAQKRAISTAARERGISVSELLRRAVLAFDATAEQVRAARIVDSWPTRQAPDALAQALRRIAATAGPARAAPPSPAVSAHAGEPSAQQPIPVTAAVARAMELRDERRDEAQRRGECLDVQTVARMTARWATASHDADNAPAFDDAAPLPTSRRARTGS